MTSDHLAPADFITSPSCLERVWSPEESLVYTRWLATHHYENFHVVSFLLPKQLHQDFYNIYSFCRWADDLGDELSDPQTSLHWLAWWSDGLDRMYEGSTTHPVFVALRNTVDKFQIPKRPFADLIRAFVQDQTVRRYPDWESLYEYCRYSANPVGHLVLYLCGYRDEERQLLSDATCTALQLANHWQDVSVDLTKNRIYIPQAVMQKHGCSDEDLIAGRETTGFISTMREIVQQARVLFVRGLPLIQRVDRRLAVDLDLFSHGGMRILDKIERQGYRVLRQRPRISKLERAAILLSALLRQAVHRAA